MGQKIKCRGSGSNQGKVSSADLCAGKCEFSSSMFIVGTNDFGENRCDNGNCDCYCEANTENDGTCDLVDSKGYRLYRNKKWSKHHTKPSEFM